jgi:hypothetical protein
MRMLHCSVSRNTRVESLTFLLISNIHRSNKRISVIFRGTVGGKDIVTDANFFTSTPEIFTNSKEDIKMHAGFASECIDECERVDLPSFRRLSRPFL